MNKHVRLLIILISITLGLFTEPVSVCAQGESSWWMKIFRTECDTTQFVIPDSSTTNNLSMFENNVSSHTCYALPDHDISIMI